MVDISNSITGEVAFDEHTAFRAESLGYLRQILLTVQSHEEKLAKISRRLTSLQRLSSTSTITTTTAAVDEETAAGGPSDDDEFRSPNDFRDF